MKAYIKNGVLFVEAEGDTEEYALQCWRDKNKVEVYDEDRERKVSQYRETWCDDGLTLICGDDDD